MISFNSLGTYLEDRQYFPYTKALIENARRHVLINTFIFDIRPPRDIEGYVLDLSSILIKAHKRGVDVRVLLPGTALSPDIYIANLSAGLYLTRSGIRHRRILAHENRQGSHAKFLICDDTAVIGSQNWTDDAFRLNIEDAIVLKGEAVIKIEAEFFKLWKNARTIPSSDF